MCCFFCVQKFLGMAVVTQETMERTKAGVNKDANHRDDGVHRVQISQLYDNEKQAYALRTCGVKEILRLLQCTYCAS